MVAAGARFSKHIEASGEGEDRLSYGPGDRHAMDLFLPEGAPKGLVVFVHGGYWKAFDKSVWSHLAAGPLAHGFAVAMPSYTLCPDIRIYEHRQVKSPPQSPSAPVKLPARSV
jgi:arylformamidase